MRVKIKQFKFNNFLEKNKQVFQLHMIPEDVPNLDELFFKLSRIIEFNERKKSNLLKRLKARKPWEPIIVSDNLSWSEFSRINLFLHELPGVEPLVSVARQYPDQSTAHLVGYVSEVSVRDLENNKYLNVKLIFFIFTYK